MSNCYKEYFETYYEDSGVLVDYASALASAAALHFLDKLEDFAREEGAIDKELEQIQYGYGCDLDSAAKERQSALYERQEEISDERDEIYSILRHPAEINKKLGAKELVIELPQIFRVDVDKLLADVLDKSTNILDFDRLLEILSTKVSSGTARHGNLLEALLDTSFFKEHKDFFESLYIENLMTDKNLLKLFNDSTEFGQHLFVRHHKDLVLALLKEYTICYFAKNDAELKWSLEEFCDKLKYYATHSSEKLIDLDEDILNLVVYIKKFKRLSAFEILFDEKQMLELALVFVNDELTKDRLSYIAKNNLEPQFDFESLMTYLKKNEKRSLLNI